MDENADGDYAARHDLANPHLAKSDTEQGGASVQICSRKRFRLNLRRRLLAYGFGPENGRYVGKDKA